jgi:hypothetical protein
MNPLLRKLIVWGALAAPMTLTLLWDPLGRAVAYGGAATFVIGVSVGLALGANALLPLPREEQEGS